MSTDDSRGASFAAMHTNATHICQQPSSISRSGTHASLPQPIQFTHVSSVPVMLVKNKLDVSERPCLQDGYAEAGWWNIHSQFLSCILQGDRNLPVSLQSACELCANLCCNGEAKALYQRVHNTLEEHYKNLGALLLSMATANDDFLGYLFTMWEENVEKLEKIASVFIELERRYIIKETPYYSLRNLGIHLFDIHIVEQPLVKKRLLMNVLFLIRQWRNGRMVPQDQINAGIMMMQEMGIYANDFEPQLISDTERYYRHEAQRVAPNLTASEYLLYATRRQTIEQTLQTSIPNITRMQMGAIVVDKFIRSRLDYILAKGFFSMIDSNDTDALRIIYTAITPQQKQLLRKELVVYTKMRFTRKTAEYNNEMKNINFLYKFKSKLEKIVTDAFNKDIIFIQAIADAVEDLVQSREPAIAIAVAQFIDNKIRCHKLFEDADDTTTLPNVFDDALTIFRSLGNKDVFANAYQRLLTSRLLLRKSNTRAEAMMVTKLQSMCGMDYMTHFTKMIMDIDEWSDNDAGFNNTVKDEYPFQFQVQTVSHEAWSFASVHNLRLPPDLRRCLVRYEKVFHGSFSTRKLTWAHSMSSLVLEANMRMGMTPLFVNAMQASVLLLFNCDKLTWEFDEIAASVNLYGNDLKSVLRTLTCCPGMLLLKDSPDPEHILEQDSFICNPNFHCESAVDLFASSLMEASKADDDGAKKQQQERLGDNRKYRIDAVIVRIIKEKGMIQHSELRNTTQTNLPWALTTSEFKNSVESLIDRGLIAREKRNNYVYLP